VVTKRREGGCPQEKKGKKEKGAKKIKNKNTTQQIFPDSEFPSSISKPPQ